MITILIGTLLYFTLCSDCRLAMVENESIKEAVVPVKAPDPTSYPFAYNDGDFEYDVADNFNFKLSSGDFEMPVSLDVNKGIEGLKTFLGENAGKAINITGFYRSDEENPTAWPNLGLARANSVKNYLVGLGISSSQTNTFGKLMDDMIPSENILLGPVIYELAGSSENSEDDLKALYDKIKTNPLVLYFDTGEAAINLTAEQRQKVADIARYLDKVPDASCSVIGHTDNTGGRATNIALGQERADFAKAYLTRNGIADSKITSGSKGPDSPIASNDTEEGRSKNRRTVVTLN
jgi:outer membrane protein OmpA-like peptidoglycan-associated protein